jgi:2-dehydro-3-deoxygalactonokinase
MTSGDSANINPANIVLADWGTSNLRLWAMDAAGHIRAEHRSDRGMGQLDRDGFGPELDRCLAAMTVPPDAPVLICGMAGAANGWHEAPYLDSPCDLSAIGDGAVRVKHGGRDIRILPGIAQRDRTAPDVMRGEETILYGLARAGTVDASVCLPGTHAKWARLSRGHLAGFRTMMTGEMFALLGEVSILRHTVGISDWSDDDFAAAVAEAHAAPADCLGRLFGLRAGPLLFGDAAPSGSARLSGLLIGAEIATGMAAGDEPLCLVAAGGMAERYAAALTALGIDFNRADAEDAVRNGLFAMAARIWPKLGMLETDA